MSGTNVRVGIVGVTGYAGMELMRLVQSHPHLKLSYLAASQARSGGASELFLHSRNMADVAVEKFDPARCQALCELVFVALPSGTSGVVSVDLWKRGLRVIDLSGDLRLPADTYRLWYGKEPVADAASAVYGLTEFSREALAQATLVANPGCYATAAILALKPLVHHPRVDSRTVVLDAKSGVTGAGRSAQPHLQFAELANDFYPYRVTTHQHTPEIEQALDASFQVLLTTQLLPVSRGIFVSAYVVSEMVDWREEIYQLYVNFYADAPFVHVLKQGEVPHLKAVQGTNDCHIGIAQDPRTKLLQIFSAIDNLQKGAAGQAIQNANVMCGFAETCGLDSIALWA